MKDTILISCVMEDIKIMCRERCIFTSYAMEDIKLMHN